MKLKIHQGTGLYEGNYRLGGIRDRVCGTWVGATVRAGRSNHRPFGRKSFDCGFQVVGRGAL